MRQTDDSDKVSKAGHVAQDVGKTDDEVSEADMMSDESHETDE